MDPGLSSLEKGRTEDGKPVTWSWRETQWREGRDPQPQGGESFKDGMERAGALIESLAKKHPGKAVVVVTHSDICAALIGCTENTPPAECYRKHTVGLGSVSQITVSASKWTLQTEEMAAFDGWTSLFDGKTLDGWLQKNGTATYRVKNGAIVGRTTPGSPNSFLCTTKDYGEFELEFEDKLIDNELNSGVQIRSQTNEPEGDGRDHGQQHRDGGPGP